MKTKKNFKKKGSSIKPVEPLKQINPDTAGVDIGSEELYACIPSDRDEPFVRTFRTFTTDIEAMAEWFVKCGIKSVAIEATGVYWIPVYDILEKAGLEVILVSPHAHKRRKKTDILDCQWLQQMHSYGLLENSFRPELQVRTYRSYVRLRERIIQLRSMDVHHMQKALHQMNIQLDNVISDITGTTGMAILRAIISGQRDPKILAQFRHVQCASTVEEIEKSLIGNYAEEFLFELQLSMDSYDFHAEQLQQCNDAIEQILQQMKDLSTKPIPSTTKKPGNKRNVPDYNLREYLYRIVGVDLTRIDGLNVLTVQSFLSEVGVDLRAFPTYKHFCSWLGTSPNRRITGGKVISSQTFKPNRAMKALYIAAQALLKSPTPLGDRFRRLRARLGPEKAKVALANTLARIIYVMITQQVEFDQTLQAAHNENNLKRTKKNLERRAQAMGFMLVPDPNARNHQQTTTAN
jgi:transposase